MSADNPNATKVKKVNLTTESRIHSILRRIYFKGRASKPLKLSDDDTLLGTLGFDSLEVMQVIVAIEDEFNVKIPDSALRIEEFESVRTLIHWAKSLRSGQFHR